LPFAQGGVVAGEVQAFAAGGVPDAPVPLAAHRDTVVDQPTVFPMRDGVGLMGEAGAEAILPLVGGPGGAGVRALAPEGEMVLPLARAASGHLAVALPGPIRVSPEVADRVAAFARGGVVPGPDDEGAVGSASAFPRFAVQPPAMPPDATPLIVLPDLPRLPAQLFAHLAEITRPGVPQGLVDVLPSHMLRPDPPRGAATGPVGASPDPVAPPPARGTRVEVVLNGASGRERVSEERFADGDDDVIRTIVDLVDGALTENAVRGRGQLTAALRQMFGSRRPGL
jgi:hypothetical protein